MGAIDPCREVTRCRISFVRGVCRPDTSMGCLLVSQARVGSNFDHTPIPTLTAIKSRSQFLKNHLLQSFHGE